MADLRLRISIVEKNERGQEVELVRKTIQFNPQVRPLDPSQGMMGKINTYSNFFALWHSSQVLFPDGIREMLF